ncbi:MAG: threonylcarbamoyl-AMP synthase [Ruminococcus sp.]|nr:threonylcarbamoyl-AMP synthase [Ruminococcus sp.]
MKTLLLTTKQEDIKTAAQILRRGGLVGMPTETVYGLAANALDGQAVSGIFTAKGRPSDNPLIVHISAIEDIEKFGLVSQFPENAKLLAENFWPGPLTIIMPKGDSIPKEVTGTLNSVGIRLPAHAGARALIREAGIPLAAPSANLSGSPSPTTAQHVLSDLDGKIHAIIDGGESDVGLESTVITVCTNPPMVLRPGGITLEDLREVLGEVALSDAVLEKLRDGEEAASPGMKYKHYSPKAKVYLVRGGDDEFCSYVNSQNITETVALCYTEDIPHLSSHTISLGDKSDYGTQAHNLFSALRQADEIEGVTTVFVRCPDTKGLGMALFNRLIRAAGFEIIDLEQKPSYTLIGLTGPTGAGKGAVGMLLSDAGCAVVDADKIAHKALTVPECIVKLTDAFSAEIINPDGSVNRKVLASCAFKDEASTQLLNSITHPVILTLAKEEFEHLFAQGYRHIVFDAPTLFESGSHTLCQKIIAVTAPRELRLARILIRDGITEAQALSRINAQKDSDFYTSRADFVISNDSDLEHLKCQTERIIRELCL